MFYLEHRGFRRAFALMSTTLTVLPIFALVFVGWAVRKLGLLGSHATVELNRFVVYLALPALLFDIVIHAHGGDVRQPGFIAAFGISSLLVFSGTVGIAVFRHRGLADAAIDGLNASYPNTGFMGFPLVLAVFGESALPLALIASIITVCLLFGLAIVLIEISRQRDRNPRRVSGKVATALLKNPLIAAPAVAAVLASTYGDPPSAVGVFLKLLSAAASPCALVALGLFLAETRLPEKRRHDGAAWLLAATKLFVQPALAWGIAAVLRLPTSTVGAVVLLAALPTGTGPFMLAELYRCEAAVTARTILLTTFVSILTITLCIRALA